MCYWSFFWFAVIYLLCFGISPTLIRYLFSQTKSLLLALCIISWHFVPQGEYQNLAILKLASLAMKGEVTYRVTRTDYRGRISFPSAVDTAPISLSLPQNLFGRCSIQFFDKCGRETRTISVTLDSSPGRVAITPQPVELDGLRHQQLEAIEEKESEGESEESETGDEAEDETDDETEDETDDETEDETEDDTERDASTLRRTDPIYQMRLKELHDSSRNASELGKAITDLSIKRASLSATELEREGDMRYELARAKLNLSHKYTREVAENHQASSLLRRDLVAMAATVRKESEMRVADSDRQIRQTTRLLIHLSEVIQKQAAAAPPVPPPQLDIGRIGIAVIEAIGMVGAAWGPNRPQLPPAQTPPLVPVTDAAMQPKPTEPATPPKVDNTEEQTDRAFQAMLELEMERAGGDESLLIEKFLEIAGKIKGRVGKGQT